ncbi:MAG: hypothetical protein ACYDBB_19820 [Armatimonadota bacterium]
MDTMHMYWIEVGIDYFGLNDWWQGTFTQEERDCMQTMQLGDVTGVEETYPGEDADYDYIQKYRMIDMCVVGKQVANFLANELGLFTYFPRVFDKVEQLAISAEDYMYLYGTYNSAIYHFYPLRHTDPTALDITIQMCEKQIAMTPEMLHANGVILAIEQEFVRNCLNHTEQNPFHWWERRWWLPAGSRSTLGNRYDVCRASMRRGDYECAKIMAESALRDGLLDDGCHQNIPYPGVGYKRLMIIRAKQKQYHEALQLAEALIELGKETLLYPLELDYLARRVAEYQRKLGKT